MGFPSLGSTASKYAIVLCGLLLSSEVGAAEVEYDARQGLTGAQLFEHEWKSFDDSQQLFLRQARFLPNEGREVDEEIPLGDGLGPLHNATSCSQCHLGGGSSGVKHNVTLITVDPRSEVMRDKTTGGKYLLDVFPGLLGPRGAVNFTVVVHDLSTRPGYSLIRDGLNDFVPDGIDDRWFNPAVRTSEAIANRPVVAGRHGPVDFYLSQRNSPALFGLGLVDSINDVRIEALAKKQAANTDGKASGRFVGKFGWRGQVNSLSTFVSQACAAELGLSQAVNTSRRQRIRGANKVLPVLSFTASQAGDPTNFKYLNRGPDMTADEVAKLTSFVASLPRPRERRRSTDSLSDVLDGEHLFRSVGCLVCHVADLRPVSGIFSDLLLHDMGEQLQSPVPAPMRITGSPSTPISASVRSFVSPVFQTTGPSVTSPQQYYGGRTPGARSFVPRPYPLAKPASPQFPRGKVPATDELHLEAFQREWKTPPLWGVADTAPYLHDGRAATLEDAILWHGGEAESSRKLYDELPRESKDLVLAFLSSLRAPDAIRP